MFPPRYDDAPPEVYEYSQPHTSTDGARPSAPSFPEHLHSLPSHKHRVWLHSMNLLYIYKIHDGHIITIDDVL